MTKILLGAIAILMLLFGLTVYFAYGEISVLQQNNAKLSTAVDVKDKLIAQKEKEFRKQAEALNVLDSRNSEITKRNNYLEKLFSDHDLNELLNARPTLMGKKMTNATKKLGEELEALTAPESYNE